ncbi:MAG: hypothetical protein CMM56_01225 [Rhodospirillaceae bacterium]|nr:hypothetical protein [Rhodospirillaceae bacterium]
MTLIITSFTRQVKLLMYGIYVWFIFISLSIPVLILLILTPTRIGRRTVAHWSAKLLFFLIGTHVHLEGMKWLPKSNSIVIANHASYLDGIILTAMLPPNFTFLIKQEMTNVPFAGYLLKRIGSEFVDRTKFTLRNKAARRLFKAAEKGESLAFFPEGTFIRQPGLQTFHMGAFRSAYRAKLPVVPIVISGSRKKLPANSWLCVPGSISVEILKPISPDSVLSAQKLLQEARTAMLKSLKEPDLDKE